MSTSNYQNPFKSAIWPAAMAIVSLIIGIKYHASAAVWIIAGSVWVGGCVIEIEQYQKDDETMLPDFVCTAGFAIIVIGAAL